MAVTRVRALKPGTQPSVRASRAEAAAADPFGQATGEQDWRTARSLFEAFCAANPAEWMKIAEQGAVVMDWLAILSAEAGLMKVSGLRAPDQLPAPMARLTIQARRRLELPRQAVAMLEGLRARDPERPEWRRRQAEALLHMGDYEGAIAAARALWDAGKDFGAVVVATALVEQGEFGECDRFLTEAEESFAGREPPAELLRARVIYWNGCSEPDKALDAVLRLASHTGPVEQIIALAEQCALAHDRERLDAMLGQMAAWRDDPAMIEHLHGAAPAVLEAHYQSFVDWQAVRPWVEALSALTLAPRSSRPLSQMLLQAGDYALAHEVTRKTLDCFSSVPSVWRLHQHILSLMGDVEGMGEARRAMRARFAPETYLNTISIAEPRSWDLSELPEFLAFNLADANSKRQHKFFASLGEVKLTPDQVDLMRAAAASGPALLATELELKLFPMRDLRLLENAATNPVDYLDFDETRVGTQAFVDAVTRGARTGDWGGVVNDWGMFECLDLTGRIRAERADTRLFTRESYAQSTSLARALVDRIERRQSMSLIRLGDGEGHFLPVHTAAPSQKEADRAVMLNIWWGTADLDAARLKRIEEDYVFSVDNANILAIIPPWRLIAELSKRRFTTVHRGILGGISYCATMPRRHAIVTSMHFPNDLHNWNLWVEIFGSVRRVSYISCHHMGPWLKETFGLEVGQAIHIPGENQFTALFDTAHAERRTGTLFDHHDDICQEIDPNPGDVYLVAAGFLGKIYCEMIRVRGGIAIDIGSLADYWMGFNTRRYRLEQNTDLSLANTLIAGHPLASPTDRSRIVGRTGAVRSTVDCRYNIATADDVGLLAARPRETRRLRLIGHPRCASGFLAHAFSRFGVEVGHQKMQRDGIVSWMHTVADLHLPAGEEASTSIDFEHTVVFVRNPADAIGSIMLENGVSRSFNFRRLHILRAQGVDLSDYGSALDRATASLVHWYEMIQRLEPEAVLRVEDGEAAVRDVLSRASIPWIEPDPAPPDDAAHKLAINSAMSTFGRPRPQLSPAAFDNLDPDLHERLEVYCEHFGYDYPWREARTA